METNMIAVVNPITRVATILHKVGDVIHNVELSYKELDEWSDFETDRKYEISFDYDEMFCMGIYEDDSDDEYHGLQNVNFLADIQYNDGDYEVSIVKNTHKLQGNEQTQKS
jgi:hypothetical protein